MWSIPKKILVMGAVVWGLIGLIIVAFIFFIGMRQRNEARVMGRDAPPLKFMKVLMLGSESKRTALVNVCRGEIRQQSPTLRTDVFTCLGDNTLRAYSVTKEGVIDEQSEKIIYRDVSTDIASVRTLVDVNSTVGDISLLEFPTAEELFESDTVMEGNSVPNVVKAAFNWKTRAFSLLQHFPETGEIIWNDIGTEAIIHPRNCYIDCGLVKLSRYSLLQDKIVFETKQEAFEDKAAAQPASGSVKSGSYWNNPHWFDSSHARVVLVHPDGKTEDINIGSN